MSTPNVPHTAFTITTRVDRHKFVVTDASKPNLVLYYILAPPKWAGEHHDTWSAIVYRGDNPKYSDSRVIGLIQRGTLWRSVTHTLNGTAARDAREEEKRCRLKELKSTNWWRKACCMRPKTLDWEEKDEPVIGETRKIVMTHTGHRQYNVVIDGMKYKLSGTRIYSRRVMGLKGVALAVKLVRSQDGMLVATFDTASDYRKKMGTLNIFVSREDGYVSAVDEQMILQLVWVMAEAEFRKRELVWEIIREILSGM